MSVVFDKNIEFDDLLHIYSYNNKPIKYSVTKIAGLINGSDYSRVPKKILDKAVKHGNDLHDIIENYIMQGQPTLEEEFVEADMHKIYSALDFIFEKKYTNAVCEETIYNKSKGIEYCGKFDIYLPEIKTLIDIKTGACTGSKFKDYCKTQLYLLVKGFENIGEKVERCCVFSTKELKLVLDFRPTEVNKKIKEYIEKFKILIKE